MQDVFEGGRKLPLMDEFYTIQGEGKHTGTAAYFIRIGGCDIGCSWCDTKLSWQADLHKSESTENIIQNAIKTPAKVIVVTGGEPTKYPLGMLCEYAKKNGLKTFLETSGVYELTGEWDWICLSPKPQKLPQASFFEKADELKVIISRDEDFAHAERCAGKFPKSDTIFLQPEWSRRDEFTLKITEYIKKNPKWKLSVQLHKYLGIP